MHRKKKIFDKKKGVCDYLKKKKTKEQKKRYKNNKKYR